jgi:pyroglutamyl-peptidase
MKNILITGFGAFLKHDVNPAQEVALSLKKEGYDSVILPVSYEGAIAAFKAIKNIKQYDAILSFGLASSRHFISLETKAYNEMNAIHLDNEGVRKMGDPIVKGAPKELSSPFNVPNLKEYLAKEGIETELSSDPGRYICNEVYYLDLSSGIPALFVHFPSLETSSIEKDEAAAKAILAYLRTL